MRYFYAWTPLALVAGTLVLLAVPPLALIALMIVLLFVVAGVARAIVWAARVLGNEIGRRRHGRHGTQAIPVVQPTRSVPVGAPVLLANPPSELDV